jgi:hypothetical protein
MIRNTYSFILVGALSACGGGSGSDTNNSTNQNTLSVQIVYQDDCGNETFASDSALLIHNNDYSTKATIYANDNGQINYQTDEENITISLITRGKSEINGVKPISVSTIIDQPVIDKGVYKYYTRETSSCECITPSFDVFTPARVGERATTSVTGYVSFGSIDHRRSYSSISGYEFCKTLDGDWPTVSISSTFSNPSESYGLLVSDLSLPSYDTTHLGTPVSIISDVPNRQVSSFVDGKLLFRNYSYFESTPLFGFDTEQTEFYRVDVYDFVDIYDVEDVDGAYLLTLNTHYTDDLSQSFNLLLPVIDYTRLFDFVLSENGRYDLSDIQGLDYITMYIKGYNDFGTVFDWSLTAPVSGIAPQIDNIDISEFISDSELESSITSMRVNAAAKNYEGINGYQDYLTKDVDRELTDLIKPEWNKLIHMSFNITTNNVDFISLNKAMPTKAALQNSLKGKNQTVSDFPKRINNNLTIDK